jgi:thioredoxin-like negative regulator of GroEL
MTVADSDLQAIRPSLRQSQQPASAGNSPPASAAQSNPKTGAKNATGAPAPGPTVAKKEDVVHEVTAANLQKLVIESPVPVLIDVYADWCGPCKQLGPILENAAVKAGGLFRLAKVNADTQREVAEALGVTGLPTVYAMASGKLTDR